MEVFPNHVSCMFAGVGCLVCGSNKLSDTRTMEGCGAAGDGARYRQRRESDEERLDKFKARAHTLKQHCDYSVSDSTKVTKRSCSGRFWSGQPSCHQLTQSKGQVYGCLTRSFWNSCHCIHCFELQRDLIDAIEFCNLIRVQRADSVRSGS